MTILARKKFWLVAAVSIFAPIILYILVAPLFFRSSSGPRGWDSSMFFLNSALCVYQDEHGALPYDSRGEAYALYSLRDYISNPNKVFGTPVPFEWDDENERATELIVEYLNPPHVDSTLEEILIAPKREYWSRNIWFMTTDLEGYYIARLHRGFALEIDSIVGLRLEELEMIEGIEIEFILSIVFKALKER